MNTLAARTTAPREKLPEKKGTIQVFFSSEVRRDRDGQIMRNRSGYVLRGYYGLIHDDNFKCDAAECREISHQVKFRAEAFLKAIHAGAGLRGASGEKVKFAARVPRVKEGQRPIVVFLRSAERQSRMAPESVRYGK